MGAHSSRFEAVLQKVLNAPTEKTDQHTLIWSL
jgi:hypothetical protein